MLRALVLTLGDHPGGKVRDAHGRIGDVHVLAAAARRAVGVDAKVLGADFHLNPVVYFRADEDGSERGMAAGGGVERRDAHQAVNADLRPQQPIGLLARHGKGGRLQPGFLARLIFVHGGLAAVRLSPAQVHAQQHLGPVLRFRAACAGVNGDNGVQAVVLSAQQDAGFDLLDLGLGRGELPTQLRGDILAFPSQVEVGFEVSHPGLQPRLGLNILLQSVSLLGEFLRPLPIFPDFRLRQLIFYLFEFQPLAGSVKDSL